MTKISNLPALEYADAQRITLIGNAFNYAEDEATGTITLDDLMSAYMETQDHYQSVMPNWITDFYINNSELTPFLSTYFEHAGNDNAIYEYLTNSEVYSSIFGTWFNDNIDVISATMFSDTAFTECLNEYIGDYLANNYTYAAAFNDEDFVHNFYIYTGSYLSDSAFSDSGFTIALGSYLSDHINEYVDVDIGYYLSEHLLSYMSEYIGQCLEDYIRFNNVADLFSKAMSDYISMYGPLPQ